MGFIPSFYHIKTRIIHRRSLSPVCPQCALLSVLGAFLRLGASQPSSRSQQRVHGRPTREERPVKCQGLAVERGKRIRQFRTKAGFSQVTFSTATGFTQGFVSRLETGKVELSIGSLRRVSDALGIPLSKLFRGL